MKKLILSISLMMTSISFSQDAQDIIDVTYSAAINGSKRNAIEWYESYYTVALPFFDTTGCVTYNQPGLKYSFCEDGITVYFNDSLLLDKMLVIADSIYGKANVIYHEEVGLITLDYDYVQFGDGGYAPAYIEAGILYYMYMPYLKEEE